MKYKGFLDSEKDTADQLYLLYLIAKFGDGMIVLGHRRQQPEYKMITLNINPVEVQRWEDISLNGFEFAEHLATALTQKIFDKIAITNFDLIEIVSMMSADGLYSKQYQFYYRLIEGLEPHLQQLIDSFGDIRRMINGNELEKAISLIDKIESGN